MIHQNKNQIQVTKVKKCKNYYIIKFNDESELKLSLSEYLYYDFYENEEISVDFYYKIKHDVCFNSVKEKVIKFAANKLKSEKEVKNYIYSHFKLKKCDVNQIVEDLTNSGIIDDNRYVKYVIDASKLDLRGTNYILAKLYASGVNRKIIDEQMQNYSELDLISDLEEETMKYLATLENYPKVVQKKKIFDKLYRKGFKLETIEIVLSKLGFNYYD